MIHLLQHNITPYNRLCKNLAFNSRCAYISATGTGKTYVVSKYIEDHFNQKNVLVLVPTNIIKNTWQELLPGIHVMTYQGISFGNAVPENLEVIICDEMHHLGAAEWGRAYNEIVKDFAGKVIGVSATPVRFLDEGRDMVEECFHGNYIKGLDLPEAINTGVLPSFHYITALYDMPDAIKRISKSSEVTDKLTKQLDLDASRHSYHNILSQHMRNIDQKIVVFVPSILKIDEIISLTMDVFPDANHYAVHSNMSKTDIQDHLESFKLCKNRSFLYTVDMLSEGMHIDDITCIIMFRKTKSPAVYLQQLGRALTSSAPTNRVLIFDFVANHINLNVYEKTNESAIRYIENGISSPIRQIMVTDYAIEDLKILERLKELLSNNWTSIEDQVLIKYYNKGTGIAKCAELLPGRKRDSIIRRAKRLGLAKTKSIYGDELNEDIRKYYLEPGGLDILMEKYPDIKYQSIVNRANRMGITIKETKKIWTEEEDVFLRDNPDMPLDELADLINVRKTQLISRRNTLGIATRTRHIWTSNEDNIIIQNMQLSSLELQEKFFSNLSISTINVRRNKLNCSRPLRWDKETVDIFSKLYQSGGFREVLKHEKFSHMNKSSVCAAAKRHNIFSPNHVNPWTEEEINLLKHYVNGGKSTNKEDLQIAFPDRSYNALRNKIKEIKSR